MRFTALALAFALVPVGDALAGCKSCPNTQYTVGYVEEQVTVKKPVLIKRTPIVETREKQITVTEQVVTGYKEEVVPCETVKARKPLFKGLFKKPGYGLANFLFKFFIKNNLNIWFFRGGCDVCSTSKYEYFGLPCSSYATFFDSAR
jgi:hypothetical protein